MNINLLSSCLGSTPDQRHRYCVKTHRCLCSHIILILTRKLDIKISMKNGCSYDVVTREYCVGGLLEQIFIAANTQNSKKRKICLQTYHSSSLVTSNGPLCAPGMDLSQPEYKLNEKCCQAVVFP